MLKFHLIRICLLAVAISLGIYGQSLADFSASIFTSFHPTAYLTAYTALSLILFATVPIISRKNRALFSSYLVLTLACTIPVSWFSLFVTIMWWG
ncbi:hypothetical protein SAMN04488134_11318 [Amphibacillus marinus]|uniref:Uncharacterized protein n=1 Tax=Amphibacillus marinus TaxID=872970 RepID=A0A1H8SKT9_9BACI|nr:hypothetical protein [Amphibacillus marinus]SEO79177.1 hypothetical protein SAMN04488134_11318 [Amphibacillus marinus]